MTRGAALGVGMLGLLLIAAAPAVAAEVQAPATVAVPAGPFVFGSGAAERERGYALDEAAYGHSVTRERRWYAGEPPRQQAETGRFEMSVTPITNRQYAAFVAATGHAVPDVDLATWAGYDLVHDFAATRRFAWRGGRPPLGRDDHPVVLVSHADAAAYARWLSAATGQRWRLPTEQEWEKAARGADGRTFPWGDAWDPARLNSHDTGPFDTMPVGRFPAGASPYGLLDAAGQVFEWTATPAGDGRYLVKGGAWDDKGCGVCRPAARHGRPEAIRHIVIGFRLLREVGEE